MLYRLFMVVPNTSKLALLRSIYFIAQSKRTSFFIAITFHSFPYFKEKRSTWNLSGTGTTGSRSGEYRNLPRIRIRPDQEGGRDCAEQCNCLLSAYLYQGRLVQSTQFSDFFYRQTRDFCYFLYTHTFKL